MEDRAQAADVQPIPWTTGTPIATVFNLSDARLELGEPT
jgi:hypothetical protein